MGNYDKWTDKDAIAQEYVVVLFISRNKDNAHIPNFVERRESFVATRASGKIQERFDNFVNRGLRGEMCRLYISVNNRDAAKVHKALIHELIDMENFRLNHIDSMIAAIAARKENAAEHKWLIDLDDITDSEIDEFAKMLADINVSVAHVSKTIHGWAVITEHGFDIRPFKEKFGDKFTLKRDDLLLEQWKVSDECP